MAWATAAHTAAASPAAAATSGGDAPPPAPEDAAEGSPPPPPPPPPPPAAIGLARCPPRALLDAPSLSYGSSAAATAARARDERGAIAEVLRAHNDTDARVYGAMRARLAELARRYASHVRSCEACRGVDLEYSAAPEEAG